MTSKLLLAFLTLFLGLTLTSQSAANEPTIAKLRVETQRITTESSSPFFRQYDIAGKPTSLAVENSGRVWVTLPEIDAIGVISVTETPNRTTTSYIVKTYFLKTGSHPYGLDVQGDTVWFTAYGSNEIGRLNTTTEALETYTLTEHDSGPTGIQVAADGIVWFAQQKANKLGKFDPSSDGLQSYPYPLANGGLERVATVKPDSIWLTAPNVDRIANFDPGKNIFISIPTLPYTRPTGLALESGDIPWVSVTGGNRIGRYAPGTLTFWRWTSLPSSNGEATGPQRIALPGGDGPKNLFYANALMKRIGLIHIDANTAVSRVQEAQPPESNCTPLDIQTSSDGSAWFTCGAGNKVEQWIHPFFFDIYAPVIAK
jgi:virginiamycin B lyase